MARSYDILSKELYKKYNETYFQKIPEEKKIEIKEWIEQACKLEYNKLKKDNLKKEKWDDEKNNIKDRIKEKLSNYIQSIFNGKYFRNEIDPNLGREDIISNIITDIKINKEISGDKQNEIYNIKNNEIHYAMNLFNKNREELPLFEEILLQKEKICVTLANNKIKELLDKFTYVEDKIIFNEDNFYSLFKKNKEINLNIPQNNNEFEYMLHNISQIKSDEYNNILAIKKPSWVNKKQEIKAKIDNQCQIFMKEIFGNKSFKEEIKYDMNILVSKIMNLNLLNGIQGNKKKEIEELIKNKIQETKQLILIETNSLSDWSIVIQLKINEGKEIMLRKLKNINQNELNPNNLKKILIDEVKTFPRFSDMIKKKEGFYNKLMNGLEKVAGEIVSNYINEKTKEIEKNKKNKKLIDDLLIKAEKEAEKRIESEKKMKETINNYNNTIQNLQNEIAQLKQRQQPQSQPQPACFPIPTNYGGGSIMDALKSIGYDGSYNYRCVIAARNGIGNGDYKGRPHENIYMLKLLREGRLIIP